MGSKSDHFDQALDESIGLLEPEAIQDGFNADGSNAIIMVGKKKGKLKGEGKVSTMRKKKEAPALGKSKQRKLKKLEEEKEKKLLQAKSIKLLGKYKISDGAYSFLHSSGTIGQVETMKEKRRRAVQFSKVGLEVPREILPFKMGGQKVTEETEINEKIDSVQTNLESIDRGEEQDDERYSQSFRSDIKTIIKSKPVADIGSSVLLSTEETNRVVNLEIQEKQKNCPPTSSHAATARDISLQDKGVEGPKPCSQTAKLSKATILQENVNTPTVVHVTRPAEVEEKRKDLPIIMMEQEIMEAINEHSIVILCGETGCGKTTQVPQFLYEAGFGSSNHCERKGIIGVTQPRRVAVLATAKRVSYELGFSLGKEVGFQVRHDKMIGKNCSIKFMTDGILLREVQSDFLLKRYSVIILDEAHERSLNTDILIGMLSRIIMLRQKLYEEQQEKIKSGERFNPESVISQLKLVLMSATLRVEDFISNKRLFSEAPPILEVPVRQFPVTIHFSKRTHEDYMLQAYKKVMSIHKRLPPGGILVFVTGQREVDFLCKKLKRASRNSDEKKFTRKGENQMSASSELDMKEISEAYEIGSDSPDNQNNAFSSYDEDENNLEINSDASDLETHSEMEIDSEDEEDDESITREGLQESSILDFLRDKESISSLKASFDALAGNSRAQSCEESPSSPITFNIKKSQEMKTLSAGRLHVLPLYAMLPASAQLRVFENVPEGERLVVVATNVAETSLTIPGIKYVVDTGKEKIKKYNYINGVAAYEVQWISKASASQRAGRAGRTGPGHCYRLYSSAAYSKDDLFSEFSSPEISKIPVDGVVLLMKFMGIDKVANFPFPTPPEKEALVEAERCLKALEALDSEGGLTPMGKAMAQYPMSPRHSRMLLTVIQIMRNKQSYTRSNFILGFAAAAASALSFSSPFLFHFGENHENRDEMDQEEKSDQVKDPQEKERQKQLKSMAREAYARFSNPSSDALTIAYALQLFELAGNSLEFCRENSLHLKTMEEMSKLRKQLLQLVFHHSRFNEEFAWNSGAIEDVESSWRNNSNISNKNRLQMFEEEILRQAICAGWADRVSKRVRAVPQSSEGDRKIRAVRYQSCAMKDTVFLHRFSSVSQSAPEFLVYSEILHTKRPYMHGVTTVKSNWLLKYATPLCTFSAPLKDPKPYYEPLSDRVFCWVNPTFGQHNWQLPLHGIPIKNSILRLSVFSCALLEGDVLPCLRSVQKFLSAPPSNILKPESLGQRRVGDLLNRMKMGSRIIDSRAMLREMWSENPNFLYSEIQQWFQERFHDRFREVWEHMHREVLLEGHELFLKRAKRGRKKDETE